MNKIAILGGGPSALFIFKRLIDSNLPELSIDIYERGDKLGCGMPYSHSGAADEHITNVSGNEIPELVNDVAEWVKTVDRDTLHKYGIDPARFNDYKVLPRLLFGAYLSDQFKSLLLGAKADAIKVNVHYRTTVLDIIDEKDYVKVVTDRGVSVFGKVIVCTGHSWPKKYEDQTGGWFDSPYPPEKIALRVNHPVAVRGASLTAIDAIRTLGRHNGRFEKDDQGILHYYPDQPGFRIAMHTRNGLLPAVRFHLEDSHLGKNTVLSPEQIAANRAANDGFLSLDYVFEENFKKGISSFDPDCYEQIKGMTMEAFVDHMMQEREAKDPFELLKEEYVEAERSIKTRTSVYWKEMLAVLSFAMNYPAKYFSAEDMLRLQKTLMPLISVVIAFVPQSSAETLMAMHNAGVLEMVVVDENEEPEPAEGGGALYAGKHYPLFVDCVGQPHLTYQQISFDGLKAAGTAARLKFRDAAQGKSLQEAGNHPISFARDGEYYLEVPGLAINDRFQLIDEFNAFNDKIYIMAVPFIGGFNPDYSGLDFGEAASGLIMEGIQMASSERTH